MITIKALAHKFPSAPAGTSACTNSPHIHDELPAIARVPGAGNIHDMCIISESRLLKMAATSMNVEFGTIHHNSSLEPEKL